MGEPSNYVLELFPVPVSVSFLDSVDILRVRDLAVQSTMESSGYSNRDRNWQSSSLSVLDSMPQTRVAVEQEVLKFKNEILNCHDTDFAFTTSWFTKTSTGGSSDWHDHRNSWISGCLYLDEGEGWGQFAIEAPINAKHSLLVEPSSFNKFSGSMYTVNPVAGQLLLFPSHLRHRIMCHHGKGDRYSLAFNTFPVGLFGRRDSSIRVNVYNGTDT
jgi:uncharacterized protein (TIGR02466 family)